MSDIDEIKSLLKTLLNNQTKMGAMAAAIEKQGQKNEQSYKTLADASLKYDQNFKVIAADLDVIKQDLAVNKTQTEFLKKTTSRISAAVAESGKMLSTLYTRFIKESSTTREKFKTIEQEIEEISDERAAAGE